MLMRTTMTKSSLSAREPEPAALVTLVHLAEAGQRMLVARIELALLQTQESVRRSTNEAALLFFAGLALTGTWLAGNYALVEIVTLKSSRFSALLCTMALHAILGAVLLIFRARRQTTSNGPSPT